VQVPEKIKLKKHSNQDLNPRDPEYCTSDMFLIVALVCGYVRSSCGYFRSNLHPKLRWNLLEFIVFNCPALQISNTCLNFNVARCSNLGTTSYHIQNSVSNSGGSGKHEFKWQSFQVQVYLVTCSTDKSCILSKSMWYTYMFISGWWFEPLWKIWKSVEMMTFPIYGKS